MNISDKMIKDDTTEETKAHLLIHELYSTQLQKAQEIQAHCIINAESTGNAAMNRINYHHIRLVLYPLSHQLAGLIPVQP